MFSYIYLTHCPIPQALGIAKNISYLQIIRLLDTELNDVGCYMLYFCLEVFFLAGIRDMFVDCINVLDIYVTFLIVHVLLGHTE